MESLNNLELGKNKVRVSMAQTETVHNNIADMKPKEASNTV